ncbi:hypothetical protein K432DRAFT_429621, partial [Lepidopterella palustris CBS 459.81]
MTSINTDRQSLQDEIANLEQRLQDLKSKLANNPQPPPSADPSNPIALHALLLLSDSALPLGSFAFSSGLESYLAHHRPSPSPHNHYSNSSNSHISPSISSTSTPTTPIQSLHHFLRLSLSTIASTSLPYVLAAYRSPDEIETLDNDFDASTPCTVARRASVAQGRALLAVWERAFRGIYGDGGGDMDAVAVEALGGFQRRMREEVGSGSEKGKGGVGGLGLEGVDGQGLLNAHLAPLWGVITRVLRVPIRDAAYLFLFSHARTVVSAAVRASVLGPYQAQGVLASAELQKRIRELVGEYWDVGIGGAGQTVPVMDLWVGRHEKLYSRIFNS